MNHIIRVVSVVLILAIVSIATGGELVSLDMVAIPATDNQPDGPAYDYRVSRYEITNEQFRVFLNNAKANPGNERGAFMYFDVDSGDVYLGGSTGNSGTNGSGTLLFDASVNGRLEYDSEEGEYVLTDPAWGDHPVTGVSWIGAAKFCNWLTLDAGYDKDHRIYAESTQVIGWRPVEILFNDWATRDMNASERADLTELPGFRLPMDDGESGASEYSEWYKVAAWQDNLQLNRLYGFGRDSVSGADANYYGSGDPWEQGSSTLLATTPVGYYDGSDHSWAFATNPNENGYGVHDLSGNVWEWMQDRGSSTTTHAIRGGGFGSASASVRNTIRAQLATGSVSGATGIRVVQGAARAMVVSKLGGLSCSGPFGGPYEDSGEISYLIENISAHEIVYRVDVDIADITTNAVQFAGCLGGPGESYSSGCEQYDYDDDGDVDLFDYSRFQRLHGGRDWVSVNDSWVVPPEQLIAGDVLPLTVSITPECESYPAIGQHTADVLIRNLTDEQEDVRTVSVTFEEPLSVDGLGTFDTSGPPGGPFSTESWTLTIENASDEDFDCRVEWNADWLTVNGTDPVSGRGILYETVIGGSSSELLIGLNTIASSFEDGDHEATLTIRTLCTDKLVSQDVTLSVEDTIVVEPETDAEFEAFYQGVFDPSEMTYTIRNISDSDIDWEVITDEEPEWLLIDGGVSSNGVLGTEDEEDETEVVISVVQTVPPLEIGTYTATLRFRNVTNPEAIQEVTRVVTAEVLPLDVTPEDTFEISGPPGGPFSPQSRTYTLTHRGLGELSWQASYSTDPPGGEWLTINDESTAEGVLLSPGEMVDLVVEVHPNAYSLPAGLYTATIVVADVLGGEVERVVELEVIEQIPKLGMTIVPAEDEQPGGPDYDFRIGTHEITQAEYAAFLNDTLFYLDHARGAYMYHDTDSDSVYLNGTQTGEVGTNGSGALLFVGDGDEGIYWDQTAWVVAEGFEDHPVTRVSWLGAVKYCNWLTLAQGSTEVAYHEGSAVADWYPITAVDPGVWATNGLDSSEREALIGLAGYRLPMSGGVAEVGAWSEWYKAAAWDDESGEEFEYGFGRDTLASADANYLSSGDSFDQGTTPVGWYDGTTHSGFVTNDTDNSYSLYDMSGNVAEWQQELGSAAGTFEIRGGSYFSAHSSSELRTNGMAWDIGTATRAYVGFRVVQAGGLTPFVLGSPESLVLSGPAGGVYGLEEEDVFSPNEFSFTLANTSGGASEWGVQWNQTWLEIEGDEQEVGLIKPGQERTVKGVFNESARDLKPPPQALDDFMTIPVTEVEPGGTEYSFRMQVQEVTNKDYVQFLNNARVNLTSPRGQYMYFDTSAKIVYVHSEQTNGEIGSNGAGVVMFDVNVAPGVGMNEDTGAFVTTNGLEEHPVVGVSWYGAVKYCNWYTIYHGLEEGERVYAEGNQPEDWRPAPVEASTWGIGDLTDDERETLILDYEGYRLPMDHGETVTSGYNEWYRASAWTGAGYSVYGFGRDVLTGADANYYESGDPSDDGTTLPGGYFDGTDHDGDFVTSDTANSYGLYDLTGNVREWMQDQGEDPLDRGVRGGCWHDSVDAAALRMDTREVIPADTVDAYTGFRMVRAALDHAVTLKFNDHTTGDTFSRTIRLFVTEPLEYSPEEDYESEGPQGGPFTGSGIHYTITNVSDGPVECRVSVDKDWVDIDGAGGTTIDVDSNGVESIHVGLTGDAEVLSPDEHVATITFENLDTGYIFTRTFTLTVHPLLNISPDDDYDAGDVLYTMEVNTTGMEYVLENLSASSLSYSISSDVDWIDLNGEESLSGSLSAAGHANDTLVVWLEINGNSADLDVGEHAGTVTFTNNTISSSETRTVNLEVLEPLILSPEETEYRFYGDPGGTSFPAEGGADTYQLSHEIDYPIAWEISSNRSWLLFNGETTAGGTMPPPPSLPVDVTLSIDSDEAGVLPEGEYTATLSLYDFFSGNAQTRDVYLTIGGSFRVSPVTAMSVYIPGDGSLLSDEQIYTLTNLDETSVSWEVTADDSWVLFGETTSGTLGYNESDTVDVSIDPAVADLFSDTITSMIRFVDTQTSMELATRLIRITKANPVLQPSPSMQTVSASDFQPGGPLYEFRIGQFEVTNEQFRVFLNDAYANPDNERGAYMYFDTDSGDVYIHSDETGHAGTTGSGTRLYRASLGRLSFNAGTEEYEIADNGIDPDGYASHPVTGVTWYGAVKFCNWLTIDQGFGPDQRCYYEGPSSNLAFWRPVTITATAWALRDLTDTERLDLATGYHGYRLPMDNGWSIADGFNEWYKAAAWRDDLQANMEYGFGRDTATGADANYKDSGDPYDNDTSPVGWYDGTDHEGTFATNANSNGYDAYDMSGNVWEWVQDLGGGPGTRGIRGGSYLYGLTWNPSIETSGRLENPPATPYDQLGFRVVQCRPE